MGGAAPSIAIAVLGAGSWGTALAIQFARSGRQTLLWGRAEDDPAGMQLARENRRFLPGARFPESLRAEPDLQRALAEAEVVVVAVPSHAFRAVLM